jgi:hypothetical protein
VESEEWRVEIKSDNKKTARRPFAELYFRELFFGKSCFGKSCFGKSCFAEFVHLLLEIMHDGMVRNKLP